MSLFEFGIGRSASAKRVIEELNLAPYVSKAIELFGLHNRDTEQAMREYRHFLYLLYWHNRLREEFPLVPTELADKLWHAHILFTRDYVALCEDLCGCYLHHTPGLQKGAVDHAIAMKRTRELHHYVYRERNRPGFDENYFAELDPKPAPRPAATTPRRTRTSNRDDGGSGLAYDPSFTGNNATPAHADVGDSDRGSGGSFFGGGHSGGGGASGDWGGGSSSDSGGGSSCGGGGGCGGGGD